MLPQTQKRTPRNSSKVNLVISFIFHAVILGALLYFAAREGLLGKQIKKIAVEMVKEKQPEKPKEPEKPKDVPKVDVPKTAVTPTIAPPKEVVSAPPPPQTGEAPPPAAPAPVDAASFDFAGGKMVEEIKDPVVMYKDRIEYALRSHWNRPEDMDDQTFSAQVEISVDRKGNISDPVWKKGSGDARWDNSVRQAIAQTPGLNNAPPPKFPARVVVVFDVTPDPNAMQ